MRFRALNKLHDYYEEKLDRSKTVEEYHSIHYEYEDALAWWEDKERRKKKLKDKAKKAIAGVRKVVKKKKKK